MKTEPAADYVHLSAPEVERMIASRQWWHRIEVRPGLITPGAKDTTAELHTRIGLPVRLDGKTVLDIGAAEGFYSFECENRGAEVTGVDVVSATDSGFGLARGLLGSKAKHLHGSIYNLDPAVIGQFDLVLCLGVLYHLRYPLLALDNLWSICKDRLILESQICDRFFLKQDQQPAHLADLSAELPRAAIAQFYPGAELSNDPTNWWSPNEACLSQMLTTSGFENEVHFSDGMRAVFHCRKVERTSVPMQLAAREWESVKKPALSFD
jgi:tRNA (mo5U34)-methyltransferase